MKLSKTQKAAVLTYVRGRSTKASLTQIQTAVAKKGYYNTESAARRLRELVSEGLVTRIVDNGKTFFSS